MLTRERNIGLACAFATVCIWSSFIVISRFAAKTDFTGFDLAALRFAFAGVTVLPWFLLRPAGRRFGALNFKRAFILAMFGGIGYATFAYSGFMFAPAAHGSVLLPGALPFSTMLIAMVLLDEKLSPRKALSLGVILCGIVLIGWSGFTVADAAGAWRGDLLFLCASSSWAVFTVLARKWQITPMDGVLATCIICACVYLPVYALFLPSKLASATWGAILFQGVYQGMLAVVIAMLCFTHVVRVFGPIKTTMFTALVPGVSAMAAVPLLGELLTAWVLGGLLAVTLGTLIGVTAPPATTMAATPLPTSAPKA